MKSSSMHFRKIAISAIMLSIALVLKTIFSFDLPLFGQSGLRIGVSGVFSVMPSILFGPVYGAVTSGLADVLGYILKPTGAYLFPLTATAALGGFLRGCFWLFLRKQSSRKMRMFVAAAAVALIITGALNFAFLAADNVDKSFYDRVEAEELSTEGMHFISKLIITRTISTKDPASNLAAYIITTTWALAFSGLFGLVLLAIEVVLSKSSQSERRIMPLLVAMVASGVIVTTLNTVILREMLFPSWKALSFFVLWLPRFIEEVLSNTVNVYFITILLQTIVRQKNIRHLIKE